MALLTARNDGVCRFSATFTDYGKTVETDASVAHGGESTSYSPVDLTIAALVNCTGTLIAIKARSLGLDTTGMSLSADYAMVPGRIGSVAMSAAIPCAPDEKGRQGIIRAAGNCPVRKSLHPDIAITLTLNWADGTIETVTE